MILIKDFTNDDIEYLTKNYKEMTIKQLAKDLNKTKYKISDALKKLGLKKQIHKNWTDEENVFLKENYLTMTNSELAEKLNRSFNSISTQLDRLNLCRNKPWTKEEEKYLIDNFINLSHREIGAYLNRTEQAVRAKCFDMDLYKKEIPWTEYELNFIKENYKELTNKEIAQILNRTENAIHLKASKMGIKKDTYSCNYHFFDTIDTEEKAYWLGFLTADGWISETKEGHKSVGIELQYGDIEHLRKFNKSIEGNYKITDRWRICSVSKNNTKTHNCVIRVYSKLMYDSLCELGFSTDKTYCIGIPLLRKDLIRHYVRGYFDGDGCFTLTNKTFKTNYITASKNFNDDMLNILSQELDIHIKNHSYVNEYETVMYRPDITRNEDKIKFLDYMYKDSTIYLDRKYKKYLKAKEKYDTTESLAV